VIPLRDANPIRRTPIITLALIAACFVVFVGEVAVMTQGGDAALEDLIKAWGLTPGNLTTALREGQWTSQAVLTVFTGMFLHGGWLHILGNMLFLWIFGARVEDRMGRLWFPLFYLLGGIAAAAGQTLVDPSLAEPVVGASGAIAAVLAAYLVLFPRARIQSLVFLGFFYQLIAVPSVIVLCFWFLLQLVDGIASLGSSGINSGVAVFAHIGGFAGGALLALPFRARLLGRKDV
jgi:membrane associated rhomboid family serine protease